jgi:hypothetical protein
LGAATEEVGGLAFALVAPLGADQDDCRHGASPTSICRLLWSSR